MQQHHLLDKFLLQLLEQQQHGKHHRAEEVLHSGLSYHEHQYEQGTQPLLSPTLPTQTSTIYFSLEEYKSDGLSRAYRNEHSLFPQHTQQIQSQLQSLETLWLP